MAIILEHSQRNVIPNWRDFKRTLIRGELQNNKNADKRIDFNISRSVIDWQNSKTIGVAADLINSAFVAGITDIIEVNQASSFILQNSDLSNSSLSQIADQIYKKNTKTFEKETSIIGDLEVDNFEELREYLDNKLFFRIINRTKNLTFREPKNPIHWVDLSRLYSFLGQEEKAVRTMEVALALAPSNRFVLRSATRLFVHFKHPEKALFYLRRSEVIKNDPWLVSAHIATSTIIEKFSPFIKDGGKLIFSKNFSNFDLTELNSSLGTLEYYSGSFKQSKKFFNSALQAPNDNTLAQIEWLSTQETRIEFNLFQYRNVINNAFEAFALDNFEKERWKDAFNNCLEWLIDMPYSKSPVLFGSYIACIFLGDYDDSIKLCELGLKANPNDIIILNNIVYSYAMLDEVKKAEPYIIQLLRYRYEILSDEMKATIKATMGLVEFRKKNIMQGKALYREAIEIIEKLKEDSMKIVACFNYLRELIILNDDEKDFVLEKILQVKSDNKSVKAIKKKAEDLYNSSKAIT